jgi:hypothetical protein
MKIITDRLGKAFNLTFDLIQNISSEDLSLNLNGLPSNTIGQQLWCMIGARESYSNAIKNGGWMGFKCSLKDENSKDMVLEGLAKSAQDCMHYLDARELTEVQLTFLMDLLEHEIQHHGQLIRYFYGNRLPFPKSWHERYTV